MMNRGHFLKELSSYIDNQLSDEMKKKVEEHLKVCKICSQELSRLRLLSEKLKSWQTPDLSSGFENKVKNEIVLGELKRGEVKMRKRLILVPSGVLAGILVLVFIGSWFKGAYQKRLMNAGYDISGGGQFDEISGIGGQFDRPATKSTTRNLAIGGVDKASFVSMPVLQFGSIESSSIRGGTGEVKSYAELDKLPQPTEGSVIVIQPTISATGEGEKIIRTAQIRLEVKDANTTYKESSQICKELGGYISSSNFYQDTEGRQAGTVTMRIPKDKFMVALDKLSALGDVENITTDSQDVTQEYSNVKTKLDAAMIVYEKMLKELQNRRVTIPEAMRLESELTPILQRIEHLKNRLEYLNNSVSFTTITINFHEPKISGKVLRESRKYIKENFLASVIGAVRFLAKAIPVAIALVIWVAVIIGAILLLKHWIVRIFKRG